MRRILYVEDDPSLRAVLSDLLAQFGYAVESAVDGREGLARMREATAAYDLLLTDVRMPHLDGIEMVRRLRKSGCTTPIVVFTAYAGDVLAGDVAANGIAGVVEKGDIASLVSLVGRAIDSSGNGHLPSRQTPAPEGDQDLGWGI